MSSTSDELIAVGADDALVENCLMKLYRTKLHERCCIFTVYFLLVMVKLAGLLNIDR